jgi:hypothetical protein
MHHITLRQGLQTSSSWLNLVERWFGELTAKRVRRGSFSSVEDLPCAIVEFLAAWNEDPKPFVWTATVESSQQKLSRCRQTLEQIQPGCTQPRIRKTKKTAQLILGHYTRVISLLQICPGPSSGKAACFSAIKSYPVGLRPPYPLRR